MSGPESTYNRITNAEDNKVKPVFYQAPFAGRMANMNYVFFEVALTLYFIGFNEYEYSLKKII